MIENKFLTEEEIFEENINKITKEFEKNKRGTNAKLERVLLEIRKEKNETSIIDVLKLHKEQTITGVLIIILLLLGLFSISTNSESMIMYYFGMVFFLAGFFIGTSQESKMVIIFLFSHGGTGIALMLGSLLYPIFDSPLLSDMPTKLIIVLIIIFGLVLIAFILETIFNIAERFDTRKAYVPFLLGIFTTAVFIATFIPRLIVPGIF